MRIEVRVNGEEYEELTLRDGVWYDSDGERSSPSLQAAMNAIQADVQRYMPELAKRS